MTPELTCKEEKRRELVRRDPLLGLDYVEVGDNQRALEVFFLGKAPEKISSANIQITGGRRIQNIQAKLIRVNRQRDATRDDSMEVSVDKAGDFSDYTLSLVALDELGRPTASPMAGFDVRYASVSFNFKVNCPSDLDCKQPNICPPPVRTRPEINYLAKDYNSFRQLILDRLAVTMPQWQENHTADIGIMLVELLAYAGDYLSYFQDAVATEAYLGTARQRISVRRHVRLVDYVMHEGCNARAWVTIWTDTDIPNLNPASIFFTTSISTAVDQRVFQARELARVPAGSYEIFEPLTTAASIQIYAAHSTIHFYTWGDCACCLPIGTTSATLVDSGLKLAPGDILIFEEIIGPHTGNPADADPTHRQAVRLTKAKSGFDRLFRTEGSELGQPIVEIEWCPEDSLTFPLCISAVMPAPDCSCKDGISVARGNVILVDHGATTSEIIGTVQSESSAEHCACDCHPPEIVTTPAPFTPQLSQPPLTHAQPLLDCDCAGAALVQDPRQAIPSISLAGVDNTPSGTVVSVWTPQPDLLESGPADRSFVVETDNAGIARLRFGDGSLGAMPDAGTAFTATYRVGNGTAGNVGAESISCLVFRDETAGVGHQIQRNPLAATGGIDPEPIEAVRLFAPTAFRKTLERAITADDYAALSADNARRLRERDLLAPPNTPPLATLPREAQEEEAGEELPPIQDLCTQPFRKLQAAKAKFRWTGSWNQVLVAIDPAGTEDVAAELLQEITAYLDPYRRVGHDVYVRPAQYVGIDLGLFICVLPDYLRGHVEAALLDVFSNRVLPDGTKGFFHPDNLTFGDALYASRIIGAAQAVQGVQNVVITRLERYEIGEPAPGIEDPKEEVPPNGQLPLGPFEIARLDNDPSFPENGRLTLQLGGGR